MFQEQLSLWESLLFVFIGVAGVTFGLGVLLLNRQHVITTMDAKFRETADEMRQTFKRDLEMQMMRMQGRHSTEIGEIRQELVLARAESQMSATAALTWQRRVEDLEKQLRSGVTINTQGDANIGGDIVGRDHTSA